MESGFFRTYTGSFTVCTAAGGMFGSLYLSNLSYVGKAILHSFCGKRFSVRRVQKINALDGGSFERNYNH